MSTPSQGLIDAHHHLWNSEQLYYPWLSDHYNPNTFMGDYQSICRPYSSLDFLNDAQPYDILASVHIEAEHDRTNIWAENDWLVQQQQQQQLPTVFVAYAPLLDPNINHIVQGLSQYESMRGIRFKPITTNSACSPNYTGAGSLYDAKLERQLAQLATYNWVWDARVPYWHLYDLSLLAQKLPQLSIVLEHTGLPWNRSSEGLKIWADGMQQLALQPNVSVKFSELCTDQQQWPRQQNIQLMQQVLAWFGIQRCMFASNFPVAKRLISFPDLVEDAQKALINYAQTDHDQFFRDNAARIYRIQL